MDELWITKSKMCFKVIVLVLCWSISLALPLHQCEQVTLSQCHDVVNDTKLPNVYGHFTQNDVNAATSKLFSAVQDGCVLLTKFLCALYLPPCFETALSGVLVLPCRSTCERATNECPKVFQDNELWRDGIQCQNFPTERCVVINASGSLELVETSLYVTNSRTLLTSRQPETLAPIDAELGENDDYAVEVVSMTSSKIPQRRYDVMELGHDDLFHGWADVQGTGAANDYCRVLGKGRRRFLSCALAGSSGQGHHYVSKLGFDVGHRDTWFMRDVDIDGRDDYCRCVGNPANSRISCMKAGDKGFYGNTVQGGSQYTLELPGSTGCHNKKLNPQFGA